MIQQTNEQVMAVADVHFPLSLTNRLLALRIPTSVELPYSTLTLVLLGTSTKGKADGIWAAYSSGWLKPESSALALYTLQVNFLISSSLLVMF